MAGKTEPNDPGDDESHDKVRQLQKQLWAAAKRAPQRRFHALYGRLWRADILREAWQRVRRNRSVAGIDRVSIQSVAQHGVERFLQDLGEVLRTGEYGAQVVRRVYIPKADGRKRPRGIPTGLRAGVTDAGAVRHPVAGTPQGGVISPLLSNTYLRVLGRLGLRLHRQKTRRVELSWGKAGFDFLDCHLHKRMSGRLWEQKRLKRYCLQRWPSPRAMNRVRDRVRELTPRGRCHQDVRSVIAKLNPVLRGWGQYFRSANAANKIIDEDKYVVRRLKSLRLKRAESCVMLRADRPPVSRVREVRMRGLKGGVGSEPGLRAA